MEPQPDLTAQYTADTAKPRFLMDLFDMGFALRHVADLGATSFGLFSEFLGARP